MDILHEKILPIFSPHDSPPPPNSRSTTQNQLIQTGFNQYLIYTDLTTVYQNKSLSQMVPTHGGSTTEYQIPTNYHKVVLSNKGHHFSDITIHIKTTSHPDYIRVNDYDLLTIRDPKTNQFEYLDDQTLEVTNTLPVSNDIYKIPDKGLPKPDGSRGHLYVLYTPNGASTELHKNLLEILNFDIDHSNLNENSK